MQKICNVTTVFEYFRLNTPVDRSEQVWYLSFSVNVYKIFWICMITNYCSWRWENAYSFWFSLDVVLFHGLGAILDWLTSRLDFMLKLSILLANWSRAVYVSFWAGCHGKYIDKLATIWTNKINPHKSKLWAPPPFFVRKFNHTPDFVAPRQK